MAVRKLILEKLLAAEVSCQQNGPDKAARLISDEELHEIRRLWRKEEGDWEDALPAIVKKTTGRDLDWLAEDGAASTLVDNEVLEEVCREAQIPTGLIRELVDLERDLQGLGRRSAVYDRLERILAKDWRSSSEVFKAIGWKPELDTDEEGAGDAS